MNKKGCHKKLIAEVGSILIRDWDPIGVKNITDLQDEYDAYIGRIMKKLLAGCTSIEIVSLLRSIEHKEIGCSTNSAVRYGVANKLMALST